MLNINQVGTKNEKAIAVVPMLWEKK